VRRKMASFVLLVVGLLILVGVSPAASQEAYYANCDEVRVNNAAPLNRGEPGYRAALDRDGDGVACEGSGESAAVAPTTPTTGVAAPAQTGTNAAAAPRTDLAFTGASATPFLAGSGFVLVVIGGILAMRKPLRDARTPNRW
jgi:Excalibur calcium-binding domain